ncbi:MAG: hypothetical protein WDM96_10350 [Lacunisphaera sp.]
MPDGTRLGLGGLYTRVVPDELLVIHAPLGRRTRSRDCRDRALFRCARRRHADEVRGNRFRLGGIARRAPRRLEGMLSGGSTNCSYKLTAKAGKNVRGRK